MNKDETEKENKHCDCKDCDCDDCKDRHHHHHYHGGGGGGGALYGFGFIGALFYFLQHAVTFKDYLWGILRAIVWPAFTVFKLLTIWKI
ncbi:MAG: hypothetical protein ABSE04_02545 [Candidatus Microgenomates bacterium]|jgi:hypothetical protein